MSRILGSCSKNINNSWDNTKLYLLLSQLGKLSVVYDILIYEDLEVIGSCLEMVKLVFAALQIPCP